MKTTLLFSFQLFFCFQSSFAQNSLQKEWDYRFGGNDEDWIYSFRQTTDGGYILGGTSYSGISGDKTQGTWGLSDYWIVKLDSLGNKQWDKNFGGPDDDYLFSYQQTTDGGYILGGTSWSDLGGDKTQPSWGSADYWIVKTDSAGTKQWDYRFGGIYGEVLYSVQQTTDGGYILGGSSGSEINGDKTQPNWGVWDYWIVKVDSTGIKQWDYRFGGDQYDNFLSLQQTTDGGYILGGHSNSGISGDKTQPNWDVLCNPICSFDYWIVKIDASGIKQWDKTFGGLGDDRLFSMQQTKDGGYIMGGWSGSQIGGDKAQNTQGYEDYWIVKVDSLGNQQWDKDFGGSIFEEFYTVFQTPDEGYLLSGSSTSPMSGDKTEDNLGVKQTWIVKTDSMGIKEWDKTILSTGEDLGGWTILTNDGCYAFANESEADTGGDKTQGSQGTYDYWILKFCDTTLATSVAPTPPKGDEVSIYPNPANSSLTLETGMIGSTATLTDISGRILKSFKLNRSNTEIDVSNFSEGMYFILVQSGDLNTKEKLVILH